MLNAISATTLAPQVPAGGGIRTPKIQPCYLLRLALFQNRLKRLQTWPYSHRFCWKAPALLSKVAVDKAPRFVQGVTTSTAAYGTEQHLRVLQVRNAFCGWVVVE